MDDESIKVWNEYQSKISESTAFLENWRMKKEGTGKHILNEQIQNKILQKLSSKESQMKKIENNINKE